MKFHEFLNKYEILIVGTFAISLFGICAFASISVGVEINKAKKPKPYITCINDKVYIEKPDGIFLMLDGNGDPLLCEKAGDILSKN